MNSNTVNMIDNMEQVGQVEHNGNAIPLYSCGGFINTLVGWNLYVHCHEINDNAMYETGKALWESFPPEEREGFEARLFAALERKKSLDTLEQVEEDVFCEGFFSTLAGRKLYEYSQANNEPDIFKGAKYMWDNRSPKDRQAFELHLLYDLEQAKERSSTTSKKVQVKKIAKKITLQTAK